jgi:hypothetical protein
MRDDMAKVVTERPRRGHGNGSKKTTGRRIRFYIRTTTTTRRPVYQSREGDSTDLTARSSRI